jgi:hypothetical protein
MVTKNIESMVFYDWARCGKYEIKMLNDRAYISPAPDSGYIRYNLIDKLRKKSSRKVEENNLVHALMNLNISNEQSILDFVNEFGLLGLLPYKYLVPMYPPVGVENELKRWMVPARRGHEIVSTEEIEARYLFSFEDKHHGYSDFIEKLFEPLDEFIEAVTEFQEVKKLISSIDKCSKRGVSEPLRAMLMNDEHYKEMALNATNPELINTAMMLVSFRIVDSCSGITRTIIPSQTNPPKWIVKWDFDSLLSAAYFFLSEYMLSNFWMGQCSRCGAHYLSSVSTQGYCSRKCEDADRKAKSRETKKKEEQAKKIVDSTEV